MGRNKPREPGASIPPPDSKSGRDRSWDREHNYLVATYRGIPRELHQRIVEIAKKKGVPVGEVARSFLEYALEAYQNGDLELTAQPSLGKFTLFPGEY
jgi:hypothetical protein